MNVHSVSIVSGHGKAECALRGSKVVGKRRKIHDFRVPHPVNTVKSVLTRRGCAIIMAGGSHVSCALFQSFFQGLENDAEFSSAEGCMGRSITCIPAVETAVLDHGEVTCMDLVTLPASEYAIGVIGTTEGCVAVVLIHGGSLFKTMEVPMSAISKGAIPCTQSIRDIAIGLDPAGRPEFVAVATRRTAVVADISYFVNVEELTSDIRNCAYFNRTNGTVPSSASWPTASYSASSPHIRDTFVASFTQSTIVRLLVPHRHNASFPVDIAFLILLSCGTVRFVERTITGGSVSVLLDSHRGRQCKTEVYGHSYEQGEDKERTIRSNSDKCTSPLPHVAYQYTLASLELRTAPQAISTCSPSVVINDAALLFNSATRCMDLVLVGAILAQPHNSLYSTSLRHFPGITAAGDDSYFSENSTAFSNKTSSSIEKVRGLYWRSPPPLQRDASSRALAVTLGSVSLGCKPQLSLSAPAALSAPFSVGVPSPAFPPVNIGGARAWWAVSERVVLPHGTLYSLSRRLCKEYNEENHQCTFSDCITSYSAHTKSWSDKIVLKGAGITGCGVGISGVSIAVFSSSPASENGAVLCAGGDLFWGCFQPEYSSSDKTSNPGSMRDTIGDSFSLPVLEAFGSTEGPVIESMTCVELSTSFVPGISASRTPDGCFLISVAGSVITLWSL